MLVYKDLATGNEVLSDSYPIKIDEPVRGMMTVTCRMKKEDGVGDFDIGANASQEEEQETLEEAEGKQGIDVVLDFKLQETQMSKKDFKIYMKEKMKTMLKRITEESPEVVGEFKEDCKKMVDWALANFGALQFFIGSDFNDECMPAMLIHDEGGINMYYFCHALEKEKF
ncbi:translationally-controlled tumor protein homolog [Pecten maximus]|uniref:translationally-controlled tumor protein homolog n=1 Tax=Pecten maximus TaxID=6579 RepID=UPI00145912E9|nr:translationally-controlled tumor protein homolog [Pecten maximus]